VLVSGGSPAIQNPRKVVPLHKIIAITGYQPGVRVIAHDPKEAQPLPGTVIVSGGAPHITGGPLLGDSRRRWVESGTTQRSVDDAQTQRVVADGNVVREIFPIVNME
jgi:hypothetical protein